MGSTPAPALEPSYVPEPRQEKKTATTQSVPIDPDEFKNDPLIQKALELFRGRIVEVRK